MIRQARKTDIPALLHVFKVSTESLASKDYSAEQIKVWVEGASAERFDEAIRNQYFLVAESQQQVIGFASLQDNNYIDFVFVHPEAAGKGLAQELIASLLKTANFPVSVDASETAKPLFEKLGFELIQKNQLEIDGTSIHNYHMLKTGRT